MKTDSDELDRDIDNARRRSAAAQLAIAEKLETVEKQIRKRSPAHSPPSMTWLPMSRARLRTLRIP